MVRDVNRVASLLGEALWDFYANNSAEDLIVNSDIGETEYWPPGYFFRGYDLMPAIEQKALKTCRGKVLDIGAGAGCHSTVLARSGLTPVPLESDPLLARILRAKGFSEVREADFFQFSPPHGFDTLLLLMNGIGICDTLDGLRGFFEQARGCLNSGGQILLDSADLSNLLDEKAMAQREQSRQTYYGEVQYEMAYKGVKGEPIDWLFVDPSTLQQIAGSYGFQLIMLARDEDGHYLAKLIPDATAWLLYLCYSFNLNVMTLLTRSGTYFALTLGLLFCTPSIFGQQSGPDLPITIKGTVYNYVDSSPVENVHLIRFTDAKGTITNREGYFALPLARKTDSFIMSAVGYGRITYDPPDTFEGKVYETEIYIKPYTYRLPQVDFSEPKSKALDMDFSLSDEELRDIRNRQKMNNNGGGITYTMDGPITQLYNAISGKGEQKEKIRQLRLNEKNIMFLKHGAYRAYIESELGLEGQEIDEFLYFCDFKQDLTQGKNYYEVVDRLEFWYTRYKSYRISQDREDGNYRDY